MMKHRILASRPLIGIKATDEELVMFELIRRVRRFPSNAHLIRVLVMEEYEKILLQNTPVGYSAGEKFHYWNLQQKKHQVIGLRANEEEQAMFNRIRNVRKFPSNAHLIRILVKEEYDRIISSNIGRSLLDQQEKKI